MSAREPHAATASRWQLSWRADPVTRALADRHYNRQAVGAAQFVPPGACVVLRTPDAAAAAPARDREAAR